MSFHKNLDRSVQIQSTIVISKPKGPSETLRDIRTSTYQLCRIEENTNRTTKFHKWTCNLTPLVRNMLKILWKRDNFSSYPQYFVTWCSISMIKKDQISLGDKRLFEIIEVEIKRSTVLGAVWPDSQWFAISSASFGRISAWRKQPVQYRRTSMARTPLGLWKLVRDRGSSSQWGLIIEPGQEVL